MKDLIHELEVSEILLVVNKTPINNGGVVCDVDNLYIVTPKYHKEILSPDYHYGYGY